MDVLALDFDGVLCDSAAELGVSAWRAGAGLWPEWQETPEPPAAHLDRFARLRPLLETGYQAILLLRLLDHGLDEATITREFPERCAQLLSGIPGGQPELVRRFGAARDRWIAADLPDWLSRHRFYPGVMAALARCGPARPVFILTTKQESFVAALFAASGVRLAPERLFGLDRGKPKEAVLAEILRDPAFGAATVHFVEDRLETLQRIAGAPGLAAVRLCLADWGYNTLPERAAARADARIAVWGLQDLLRALAV